MSVRKISDILSEADRGGYAVTAFDCFNFETVNLVVKTAEELKTPTIVMIYPEMTEYVPIDTFAAITKTLAEKSAYPVGLMLDHGNSFELAMRCLRAGFPSIMVDFSAQDYEKNVAETKRVVDAAHAMGVDVEAELGHVGDASRLEDFADERGYTDPELAKEFAARTGCDVLAVAFGSAHGNYVREPKLDMERLQAIKAKVSIPIVLHGGTGIPDAQIKQAVRLGIRKLNVGTGFDQSMYFAMKENMSTGATDPYIFSALEGTFPAAKAFLKSKIELTRYPNETR